MISRQATVTTHHNGFFKQLVISAPATGTRRGLRVTWLYKDQEGELDRRVREFERILRRRSNPSL